MANSLIRRGFQLDGRYNRYIGDYNPSDAYNPYTYGSAYYPSRYGYGSAYYPYYPYGYGLGRGYGRPGHGPGHGSCGCGSRPGHCGCGSSRSMYPLIRR